MNKLILATTVAASIASATPALAVCTSGGYWCEGAMSPLQRERLYDNHRQSFLRGSHAPRTPLADSYRQMGHHGRGGVGGIISGTITTVPVGTVSVYGGSVLVPAGQIAVPVGTIPVARPGQILIRR